jgi:hypothetical protein
MAGISGTQQGIPGLPKRRNCHLKTGGTDDARRKLTLCLAAEPMIESRHLRFAQPAADDHRSLRGDIRFGSGRLQIGQKRAISGFAGVADHVYRLTPEDRPARSRDNGIIPG